MSFSDNTNWWLHLYGDARRPTMVVSNWSVLCCWHNSCDAFRRVHASEQEVWRMGDQAEVSKVWFSSSFFAEYFLTESLLTDISTKKCGATSSRNFSISRTTTTCQTCNAWSIWLKVKSTITSLRSTFEPAQTWFESGNHSVEKKSCLGNFETENCSLKRKKCPPSIVCGFWDLW